MLIGITVQEPKKMSEKAYLLRMFCNLDDPDRNCEVLQRGQCINSLAWSRICVYGDIRKEDGWTRRAKKYWEWIHWAREEVEKGARWPQGPREEHQFLSVVGEYAWLPYSFMANNEAAPFLVHGDFAQTAQPFMRLEDFTPKMVVALATFLPQGVGGGEIEQYQRESVPTFLMDLKHKMPDLYARAAELEPEIIVKTPDYNHYKDTPVPVRQVTPGGTYTFTDERLECTWDGERVVVQDAGEWIIAKRSMGWPETGISVSFVPTDETMVYVDDTELRRLFKAGAFVGRPAWPVKL